MTDEQIAEMTAKIRRYESDYRRAKDVVAQLQRYVDEYELAKNVVEAFETTNGVSEYRRARIGLAYALLERQVGKAPEPSTRSAEQPGWIPPEAS